MSNENDNSTHVLVVNDAVEFDFLENLDIFLIVVVVAPAKHD